MIKNSPANAGDARDVGSIPGLGRSPGEGNGNPLQYYCLENPQGQRSLAGCIPWGHKESDNIEQLRTHTLALVYNICSSLSDLLHSVQQALGSSTSLYLTLNIH